MMHSVDISVAGAPPFAVSRLRARVDLHDPSRQVFLIEGVEWRVEVDGGPFALPLRTPLRFVFRREDAGLIVAGEITMVSCRGRVVRNAEIAGEVVGLGAVLLELRGAAERQP